MLEKVKKGGMTFLKVLEATKHKAYRTLAFGEKIFDLPEFLRHWHTIFNRKVFQGDGSAVLAELFL